MGLLPGVIALAIQSAAPEPPGRWRIVRTDQDAVVSLDEASVARDGDRVRARIRAVLAEPYNGVHATIAELEADCRARTVRTLAVSALDGGGRLVSRTAHDEPALSVAGTGDASIHDAICRLAGLR